jgi:hypothetical protein
MIRLAYGVMLLPQTNGHMGHRVPRWNACKSLGLSMSTHMGWYIPRMVDLLYVFFRM